MKTVIYIFAIGAIFSSCKKDIPKDEISNNEILVKQDSCYCFLPNAFSPDNNSMNDILRPALQNVEAANYTFTVRNDKQKVLYSTTNRTDVWSGDNQPEGEYLITLKGTFTCGSSFEEHNCVNLIRDCIPTSLDINRQVFESMFDPITATPIYPSGETICP